MDSRAELYFMGGPGSRGSSEVLLGLVIPYNSAGSQPPAGLIGVGHPQGEFDISFQGPSLTPQ
jgi:hypothetical protein